MSRPQGSACDIGAFELDQPPIVTINQASGQADPATSSPISFTAVFNEPVSGFTDSDVTLSGTAGATTADVTEIAPNDGITYDVAVSGMTTDGTVIASIPANAAQDADQNGNTASTSTDNTVTFIANSAPTAVADSYSTDEDTLLTGNVLANDSDPDGDTLTAALVSDPAHGTLVFNADGSFSYTPNANYNGPDSFTYKANDGSADSNEATVSITVDPVNDAPGFTKGADQTVDEDAGAQTVMNWATNISAGPSDESGQSVNFPNVTNDNNSLFTSVGQPKVSSDGTLTYTPAPDANGSATVSVQAKDSGGTANGGADTSVAQIFTITINAVNDAPSVEISDGACLSDTAASGRLNLAVADVDDPAGSLTLSAASSNTSLIPNSNLVAGGSGSDRTLTLKAAPKKSGTATITVSVTDGKDGTTLPVTPKVGTQGRDVITGTEDADVLFGLEGQDTLTGGGGRDLMCGGNGSDLMRGQSGADVLDGGRGDDRLNGRAGGDQLFGRAGEDTLTGEAGADHFSGGAGTDIATDYDASEGDTRDGT